FGSALWLFRDRTGLLSNAIGWPLLSCGIALVVFVAADRTSVLGRWRVFGAEWIAAVSYSLYLSHKLAFHAVYVRADGLAGHPAALFALYCAAVLFCGALLHYGVERPFLKLRDRRARRHPSASPQAQVAVQTA